MKYISRKQLKIIQEPITAPEEFERRFNSFMQTEAGEDCEIETRSAPGVHCVYIWHTVKTMEPESITDLVHVSGKDILCCDCPYMTPERDARKKTSICTLTGARVPRHGTACEHIFYAYWARLGLPLEPREYAGHIDGKAYSGEYELNRDRVAEILAEAAADLEALPVTTGGRVTEENHPELFTKQLQAGGTGWRG